MTPVPAVLTASERVGLVTMRRVRTLGGVDQVRLVAAALLVFLLFDFVRLAVTSPIPLADRPLILAMDVIAYVAILTALWRPRAGLGLAAIPLLTALFWTSTSMDALLLTVVLALGLTQLDRRTSILVSVALLGYVAARVVLYSGDSRPLLALTLGVSLAIGLALGWAGLVLRERRERAERSAAAMAAEDARIRTDERRVLSRELHDVVAHQLSTASLQIMGAQGNPDAAALHRVLATVDRATAEALAELRLLVRVLRDDPSTAASGTEIRELGERIPPTQAAAAAELALIEAGFEPDVQVPASADDLEMTVQRTLSRVLTEGTQNVLQHAPARSRCVVRTVVSPHQVSLQVRSQVPPDFSAPSLGWGLRGLRERLALTGGTFTAGIVGSEWIVAVTVPRD